MPCAMDDVDETREHPVPEAGQQIVVFAARLSQYREAMAMSYQSVIHSLKAEWLPEDSSRPD